MTIKLAAEDRLDIQDLLHSYAWSIDTGDVDRAVALFAENAVLVWDAFEQPEEWHGHAEIRAFVEHLRDLSSTAGRQHHVANISIEHGASANTAHATAYVVVMVRQDDAPSLVTVMGWYEDDFARGSDGWKIVRHVIRDWSGPVLRRIAGQTGQRVPRARPAALDVLGHSKG